MHWASPSSGTWKAQRKRAAERGIPSRPLPTDRAQLQIGELQFIETDFYILSKKKHYVSILISGRTAYLEFNVGRKYHRLGQNRCRYLGNSNVTI